jgi:hypothetical protein
MNFPLRLWLLKDATEGQVIKNTCLEYQMFMLRALIKNVYQFREQQGAAAVAIRISGNTGSSRQAE